PRKSRPSATAGVASGRRPGRVTFQPFLRPSLLCQGTGGATRGKLPRKLGSIFMTATSRYGRLFQHLISPATTPASFIPTDGDRGETLRVRCGESQRIRADLVHFRNVILHRSLSHSREGTMTQRISSPSSARYSSRSKSGSQPTSLTWTRTGAVLTSPAAPRACTLIARRAASRDGWIANSLSRC